MHKSNKKLMVIGASWEQVPLLRTAKSTGCEILATNLTPDASGFDLATQSVVVDPRDLTAILNLATASGIQGVTADECDYSNYAANFVREMLSLPSADLAGAQVTTNKHWMRARCHENHVVQPRFQACRTLQDVQTAIDLIDYPVIVKPVDNRGSFGVRRVDGPSEVEDAFLHALMNSHSREVLVEAFIEGIHLTVDGCFDGDSQHYNLGVASKKITSGSKPIITEVMYPADISEEQLSHVLDTNTRVIAALGLTRGLTHSEYILDSAGRCFLLETANRGGGVLTSGLILPEITGVDLNRLLVQEALGEPFEVSPWKKSKAAKLVFFIFDSGTVTAINGIEEAAAVDGVKHLQLLIKAGDEIGPPESGAGRHGFGIFVGDDIETVDAIHAECISKLKIEYA
ncbi:ATP-grasp domain-containing protein [Novipirellula sp.]|uniref:ATP-grasp domain-containing protein n=1 Tax=Novipirellula sp. TaxID=2795430 RepID=UPI0035688ECA